MTGVSHLKVAMAQVNLLVGDIEGNCERILEVLGDAEKQSVQVLVFPELSLTGYPPEDLLLRDGLYLRIEQALEKLCARVGDTAILIGYPRRHEGKTYNMAGLIQHGSLQAQYCKQTLPNYSVFDEKRYFEAGDQPCVIEVDGFRLGVTICEDAWQAGPMLQAVDAGAQLLINLNASPYQMQKGHQREQLIQARIAETGVGVIYVNLVGGQDELVFDGQSFAMNAQGEVVCRANAFEEVIINLDCSLSAGQVDIQPAVCTPMLDDVDSAYRALVLGVADYINKNNFNGVVIGLSGGIDSALTLAVAVDALGADRVEAVTMPSRYTADMSIDDALEEAQLLGVDCQVIPIEPMFNSFLDSLEHEFAGKPVDVTEENIQARCRGVILMAISNKKGRMVLTTGNKSEMAVGYATLYGDMAGGFCVLKDVPKTLVYSMAEFRNSQSRVIPQRVIDRPPSAELAPDQKDEDSLPAYEILDPILQRYVEQDQCKDEIVAAGFDEDIVSRVIAMVDRNEYKRRQAPPGVRITQRAFGRDRRYPITSGFGRNKL